MLLLSSKRARFQPRTSLLSKRRENNQQRGKGENLDLSLIHKSKPEVMKKENGKQEQKLCSSDEKRKWKNMETTEAKLCSSGEEKGEWKTWKRRQELCSSDENRGWENIKNESKNSVQVMRKG